MADFNEAVDLVLSQEGVLSSDPAGGFTKFGISSSAYPKLNIPSLTKEDAILIYKVDFWKFDGLKDQRLANLVFSLSVNMGKAPAIRLLQKSVGVLQDGIYGAHTESVANNSPQEEIVVELGVLAIRKYTAIALAQKNPDYLVGWVRRVLTCLV